MGAQFWSVYVPCRLTGDDAVSATLEQVDAARLLTTTYADQLAWATTADEVEQGHLRVELATLRSAVRSEKLGEVAAEFEAVHDIARAQRVGSVHAIVPAAELRPRLVAAVERGMARA